MRANEFLTEKWSEKYKSSINCSHPKGFSQRAHCAGKKKHNESVEQEMTCPDCGMCETHGNMTLSEIKQRLDPKCWKGKHKEGTKIKGGVRVNNCVPNESQELDEIDRRGFLKGLGAAAGAAALGGMPKNVKAQSADYVQLANYAVQQANEIVTSYASVMSGQRRSYFANYTRENVYNSTIWYLNNTGGYNAEQSINYSLSAAKRECDALSTGIGDFIGGGGLRDNLGMKVVNTFVQTYNAAIQQKFNEVRQASANQQKQSQQSDITSTPVDTQKVVMDSLMLYYYCKGFPGNQACETIKSEIGKYTQINNQKDAINSLYSKTSEELDRWKVSEKDKWDKLGNIITKDSANIIQSMQKINSTKKPEFESVEQGVAENKELAEEFDLIENIIEDLAGRNGVDSEVIWEDLESLTDDELYVFATTTPVMESQGVAEGSEDKIYDHGYRDGSAGKPMNDKGYDGNAWGSYRAGYLDGKEARKPGVAEDWQKANKKDKTDGMSRKAVKSYRREHPGSKLQTAVTTKPSKLKKGSKASKRRKSYCSRSKGQMKMHSISCAKTPDKAICKARRRWNC